MHVHIGHAHHLGHAAGMNRAFEFGAVARILVVLLAFTLAIVARYAVMQWAEREYGISGKANAAGWLAFFAVLIVVGLGGLRIL
jgi:hypothetical protein